MSIFSMFMKWKLRFAALSGFFTLILVPLCRLLFKPRTTSTKQTDGVIDVQAKEIKK